MIDVEVPILGKVYDFKVDEREETGVLAEEIVRQIKEKEAERYDEREACFLLCLPQKQEILNPKESLLAHSVTDGDRLLLL